MKPIKKKVSVVVAIEIFPDGKFYFDANDVAESIRKKLLLKGMKGLEQFLPKVLIGLGLLFSLSASADPRAIALRCAQYMEKPAAERAFDCGADTLGYLYLRTRVKRPKPADEAIYIELKEGWIMSSLSTGNQMRVIESSTLFKAQRISFYYRPQKRITSGEFDGPEARIFWKDKK